MKQDCVEVDLNAEINNFEEGKQAMKWGFRDRNFCFSRTKNVPKA